jgi:hypothetical protein
MYPVIVAVGTYLQLRLGQGNGRDGGSGWWFEAASGVRLPKVKDDCSMQPWLEVMDGGESLLMVELLVG